MMTSTTDSDPHHETTGDTHEAAAADDTSALVGELAQLVRTAARRPDLVMQEGKTGCSWSFDWGRDIVTVNPEDLRALAPDLCRGLALHEATHAAVTVLHDILPSARLRQLLPLLNTLEDIRIEVWMRARFPGATPWIRAYNDVFYGRIREEPLPLGRQAQFLRGVLELWWLGTTTPGTLPEVEQALALCGDAIAAATACQPPLDDDRPRILASQRQMWEIVQHRILPTWERLVAADRRQGIPRLTAPLTETISRAIGRDSSGDPRQAIAARLGTNGSDHYTTAWRRVAAQADQLGDDLLRILVPQQQLRWTSGHAAGPRLDLRRAMQCESDPQQYHSLWCRPVLPHRRDAALALLIDHSSSMLDRRRIEHAFDGLVLLVEVCRRIGVPAAVWSFANTCRQELDWSEPLDAATRHRLGRLPDTASGTTAMGRALNDVRTAFATRRANQKILFVIGDGEPDHEQATLAAVSRLDHDGIATIGLGLGEGTSGLARFFTSSITEIPPSQLVNHLASLITTALTTSE